jgi:transcriptional regulator with XRE-family HTH domain
MDKRALAETFGNLVRRLRLERGFSQEAYAQACGLERPHVGKIERGEINVTVATTVKLVDGLGLTLAGFFAELERELRNTDGENRTSTRRPGAP